MEFLLSDVIEILYGGAIRGGKSFAILVAACMYVDVPDYSAIIFRKQKTMFTDMADSLLDLSRKWDWVEKGAKYNAGSLKYTFPSGANIIFGYMGEPRAQGHKRHKSAWYQAIFFDQVEEIPEHQYKYMNSRLGRLEKNSWLPLRFWSTANPDGYEWVYEHFVQEETRDPTTKYIPATADDNPWIDLEALEERLLKLDPVSYRQLRKGIWGLSTAGGMFDPTNFIHVQHLPLGNPLLGVRYWDLAATDEMEGGKPAYSCGVRMFRDLSTNLVYTDDTKRERWSPLKVELNLKSNVILDTKFAQDYNIRFSTYIEREPGSSGKAVLDHYIRDVLPGFAVFEDRPTGPKDERAKPWAACVARRFAHLVWGGEPGSSTWIDSFKKEHRQFPAGEFADQVDASSGAYNQLFDVARPPKVRHA